MTAFCKKSVFIIICALLFGCKPNVKVDKISADIFFREAEKSAFKISPDGKYLSYLKPYKGKLNIFVEDIERKKNIQVTICESSGVKYYLWAGNEELFYVQDKGNDGNYQAFTVSKDGKVTHQIKTSPKTKIEIIDGIRNDNRYLLIALNEQNPEFFDVYKLDIKTGQKTLEIKNPGNIVEWISDNNGSVRLAIGSDGVNETLYFRASEKDAFKPVISNNFKNMLQPLCFTGVGNHIYALSNLNRDKLALVDFDCETGKEAKVIYENPEADVLDVVCSKAKKKLVYLTYEVSKRELYFFDDKAKEMYAQIKSKLPQQEVKIIDKNQKEDIFLLRTFTDRDPGAYYLYHAKDKQFTKLSEINPGINPTEMCQMQAISYKSRDGLTIHGYLTLPLNQANKNLPCVILPHSGSSNRNVWGYNAEVQFLANQGYAVFQMNFRGSSGYGKAFQTAGYKQWGTKVQDDITDGVEWLIKEKIADPKRIGIYGFSFGGYSALNQIIYHPNLYQCAASYSGFINLFTYLKGFPAYYKPYQQMLNEIVGNPESDVEELKYASPIFQIDKIKMPTLIAQGAKDPRVNVNETNQFVKELRKHNQNVNYLLKEDEGHYFNDPKNRLEFYQKLEIFLNKYLHPER
ncbi:MAG: S9 family peptidase [Sphingobacteriales bacterium]|nr:S9 family peptidase [Sphingobacteriales bacterium]